ncbi:unnamed protein product [Polarella glacialis]|uniref:Uncharacterized protein n=1 Tax=Polarella glacialis TaxID=89957 RepID=A0A813FEA4_POLGL|nr:unnamed protein product [Polarella glacialis]
MAGALVAVVRGSEPLSYIDRCFQEAPLQAPAAPAEVICLEAVEIGGYDSDWRRLAEVDSSAGVEVRRRVRERVVDSAKAWEDFVHGLESGRSRAQLRVELTQAAEAGDLPRLAAAIEAGAPLDAGNEYGQTAAFLAALGGQTEVLRTLAAARADLGRAANGGVTPCRAAMAKGFKGALEVIAQEAAGVSGAQAEALACLAGWSASSSSSPSKLPLHDNSNNSNNNSNSRGASSARVTTVIPAEAAHPGARTTVVDGAFTEEFLERLEQLWRGLPLAPKEKVSPTDRAYFADVEGWLTSNLDAAVRAAGLPDAAEAMPNMRFLIYPEPGGSLPAHVDLVRKDSVGRKSTYSFLLYLSDCDELPLG